MKPVSSRRNLASFTFGLLPVLSTAALITISANAADSNWDGDTDGNWNTLGNWTTGALPNNSNAFFNTSTPNNTVNLASSVGIFNLNFSSSVGALGNYTFGGAGFSASGSGASVSVAASVTNGATLTWNNNWQTTTTNRASGPGSFSISTASGSNANLIFNGNLTTSGAAAQVGLNQLIDFKLSNAAASGGTTVNGIISNSTTGTLTGITKTGGGQGVLTLNGANTFSGQTAWNTDSGSIVAGNAAAFGTGAIRIAGTSATGLISANTALTGANAIANTINFNSASLASTTTTATISVTAGSFTGTLTGGVSPAVGDIVFAGGNSNGNAFIPYYTRVTGVSGTTITFDKAALTTGTTAALTTQNYTASSTGSFSVAGTNAIEFSGTMNLSTVYSNGGTATRTFAITNTADTTFSGTLQQLNGVASMTKTGAGRLILSGTNTYTGANALNGGTLQIASAQALGGSGTVASVGIISFGGGTLQFSAANVQDYSSRFSTGASQAYRLDTNGQTVTLGTALTSSGGTLTKLGAGTLITTSSSNSYAGVTTISTGTLQLGNGSTTGALATAGTIVNNGTLAFNRSDSLSQGGSFSSAAISGSGSLIQQGLQGSTLTLTAANTYAGTTTIQNGTINVGANSILSGTNGPLGNATSAIVLGNASTPVSTSGGFGPNLVLAVTATGLTTQNFTIDRAIDSSTISNLAGRANIRYNNNTVGATGTLTVSGNWTLNTGGTRAFGLTAQQAGQTLDYTGAITGGSSGSTLRINDYGSGVGVVRLSNSGNTYAGQTTVTNGTLLIAGNAASGSGVLGNNSTLNLGESGNGAPDNAALIDGAFSVGKTINLNNGTTTTSTWTLGGNQAAVSEFAGAINTANNANSRTLRLTQVSGGTVTFSGIIGANAGAGTTSVDKIGAGTAILSNANSYDGTTAVTAGTLLANNTSGSATGAGVVSVGSGGTLGGTGSVAGQVNVTGVLAPGASIESLGTGNLNFLTGSTLAYELNSLGFNGDLLASTGTLDIASGAFLTLDQLGAGILAPGSKLTLISYFGGWTSSELFTYAGSTLGDDTTFFLGANEWMFNYNDTNPGTNFSSDQAGASSFVTMTVVPEPAAALLGGLGLLTLLRRRRDN